MAKEVARLGSRRWALRWACIAFDALLCCCFCCLLILVIMPVLFGGVLPFLRHLKMNLASPWRAIFKKIPCDARHRLDNHLLRDLPRLFSLPTLEAQLPFFVHLGQASGQSQSQAAISRSV